MDASSAQSDRVDDWIQNSLLQTRRRLAALLEPSRKDDGCISYKLHEETDKPGHFWFIEVWASLDKLNAHLETPKLKDLFAKQEQYLSSCTVQTCTNVEEK